MIDNRKIAIATKHAKELVIAPILEKSFGSICITPDHIDTDSLGTFSGEVERKGDPLNNARRKCFMAMDITGCDLSIASEGSFGSHPVIFFAPANEEFVLLVDQANDWEIFGHELTAETNFDQEEVKNVQQAFDFAYKVGFPSHGLILRKSKSEKNEIYKGITDEERLKSLVIELLNENSSVWLETDMRAMYNPTRMKAIERATQNLVTKLKSLCPSCEHPGFWISNAVKGLPCSMCGMLTQSTLAHEYSCIACDHTVQKKYPKGKRVEDPMYCDFCNP